MKMLQDMLVAQTKLEVGASLEAASAEKLRAIMLEVAAGLDAAIERGTRQWAALSKTVKTLEKGE